MTRQSWHLDAPCLCPDCDGSVTLHGYHIPAHWEAPAEGESNAEPCDTCGYDDWTDAEVAIMLDDANRRADPRTEADPDD